MMSTKIVLLNPLPSSANSHNLPPVSAFGVPLLRIEDVSHVTLPFALWVFLMTRTTLMLVKTMMAQGTKKVPKLFTIR